MTHTRRALLAIILAFGIGATVLVDAEPAAATTWQTLAWWQGRHMDDWYGHGAAMSSGTWLYSTQTDHVFLWTARHGHECSYGTGFGSGSCPFLSKYENSSIDKYDGAVGQIWFPNGSWAQYDMMLVDFGPRNTAVADTPLVWNYCAPYPNCSSSYGGGTATNPPWAGYNMTVAGWVNPWVGMTACSSGMRSGTFCGELVAAQLIGYSGYQEWAWRVSHLGNCQNAPGNSAGPVYYSPGDGYIYAAGMLVASSDIGLEQVLPGNPCFNSSPVPQFFGRDMYFIPWSSAASAWPTLGLQPLNLYT